MTELHNQCGLEKLFEGWNWFNQDNYDLIEKVEYF